MNTKAKQIASQAQEEAEKGNHLFASYLYTYAAALTQGVEKQLVDQTAAFSKKQSEITTEEINARQN